VRGLIRAVEAATRVAAALPGMTRRAAVLSAAGRPV